MSVHERLIAILSELPAIGKNQRNEQQRFVFRGHDDILNALNPLLAKHGVIVVPDVIERVVSQRQTSKGSVMYEVNLHVTYRFYGADGDYVLASTWGEGTDMGDKATNKAMTMAFKNVLNQTFAISSAETVDADGESPPETQFVAPTSEQIAERAHAIGKPEHAPSAADKQVTAGQLAQIATTLKLLEKAFPEHPGEGRTWADVAKEHVGGRSADRLSMAEANELNDWLEAQFLEAQKAAEIPFG